MKTKIVLTVSLIFLLLAACSNPTSAQGDASLAEGVEETSPDSTASPESNAGQMPDAEMPLAMQLAIGTLKLAETDYPITADQAAKFLPLWKAANTLSQSQTTAQEEIKAILKQIQNTFTEEQLTAIAEMDLTMQSFREVAEELGLEIAGPAGFGDMDEETRATLQAARESGQQPPAGFGDLPMGTGGSPAGGGMGQGPGAGQGMDPQAIQTAMAERGSRSGASLGLSPAILQAVIEYLETLVE